MTCLNFQNRIRPCLLIFTHYLSPINPTIRINPPNILNLTSVKMSSILRYFCSLLLLFNCFSNWNSKHSTDVYYRLEWVPPPVNYPTLLTTGSHNTSPIFFFYSLYFHFDLGFQKTANTISISSLSLSLSLSTLHGFKPSPKWRSKRKRQIRSSSQASSPRFLSFTGIRISPP
jgi:hypothetical protein